MNWIFLLLAFLIGIANTLQSGVNAQLRESLGNPILAAIFSFLIGLVVLTVAYFVFNQNPKPSLETVKDISFWRFTGGLLGAFYVMTVIMVVRNIGPANMICLVVAGQIAAAMVIDHFGFQGFAVHPMNLPRAAGGLLLIAGVYLILKY